MYHTVIHNHRWETIAYVSGAPDQEGQVHLSYVIIACRGCGWAAPEPSENFLMADPEHRDKIENQLADFGLRMCWTGEES